MGRDSDTNKNQIILSMFKVELKSIVHTMSCFFELVVFGSIHTQKKVKYANPATTSLAHEVILEAKKPYNQDLRDCGVLRLVCIFSAVSALKFIYLQPPPG
jgi:hypothetical protein